MSTALVEHSISARDVVISYIDDINPLSTTVEIENGYIREVSPKLVSVGLTTGSKHYFIAGKGPGSESLSLFWWRGGSLTLKLASVLRLWGSTRSALRNGRA